jgi:hypothetical protein
MPESIRWFCLSAVVIVLDYVTKVAVLQSFAPGESRAVAPFFNLVLVFNKGAAFSFLATAQGWQTLFFAAIAIVASVVISFLIVRKEQNPVLHRPGAHPGRRAGQPVRPGGLRARGGFPRFPRRRLALAGVQRRRLCDHRGRGDPHCRKFFSKTFE